MIYLKAYRTIRKLSQQELSERAGVSTSTVSRLEADIESSSKLAVLSKLARELRISIDTIMTDPEVFIPSVESELSAAARRL